MTKIKFTYSNGAVIKATLREKEEPECAADVLNFLKNGPVKMATYHTISTGGFYAAYPRPSVEPMASGSQVNHIGRSDKMIYDLQPGEISWPGNFWFTYDAHLSEPAGIGGPVIATVDPEYMDEFMKASFDVWENQYRTHKLVVITAEREDD